LRMRVKIGNRIEERDLPQRDHFQGEMDHMSDCVMGNPGLLQSQRGDSKISPSALPMFAA
jgi:hypothetical protein